MTPGASSQIWQRLAQSAGRGSAFWPAALTALTACAGLADDDPIEYRKTTFIPSKPALQLEYRVAYRFLSFELRQLAMAKLEIASGSWSNRVSGQNTPVVLMDSRVDSLDALQPPERNRMSMHVRMMILSSLPDMRVLFYGKSEFQHLNPLFGRSTDIRDVSFYSMESGSLQFWRTNCMTGEVTTDIANAAALADQSLQVMPTLSALCNAFTGTVPMPTGDEGLQFKVNIDERAVPLVIEARRGTAPATIGKTQPPALVLTVAPAKNSGIRSRPFKAWVVPYRTFADLLGDARVKEMAADANPEGLVPLALDYGLALGSVRCTLTGVRVGTDTTVSGTSNGGASERQPH